jgi:chorismate dehydratase
MILVDLLRTNAMCGRNGKNAKFPRKTRLGPRHFPERKNKAYNTGVTHNPSSLRIRIGAVRYLNARPLTDALPDLAPNAEIVYEVPSRLADDLAAGRLDVAMIPSIEYFRGAGYSIVSDACIACRGPVRSLKLFGRTPVERIRTLTIDEGSRTSAVLARILLRERWGLQPELRDLPIGAALEDADGDAVLLIGDRGMAPADGRFEFVWDLGQEWFAWTGLPLVCALWIARPGIDRAGLTELFSGARDEGVRRLAEIARREAPKLGMDEEECLSYLRDHLHFYFGPAEQQGLQRFYELARKYGWATES